MGEKAQLSNQEIHHYPQLKLAHSHLIKAKVKDFYKKKNLPPRSKKPFMMILRINTKNLKKFMASPPPT